LDDVISLIGSETDKSEAIFSLIWVEISNAALTNRITNWQI
jgi:hypothetical protein